LSQQVGLLRQRQLVHARSGSPRARMCARWRRVGWRRGGGVGHNNISTGRVIVLLQSEPENIISKCEGGSPCRLAEL
jgi:hypothetical protein